VYIGLNLYKEVFTLVIKVRDENKCALQMIHISK